MANSRPPGAWRPRIAGKLEVGSGYGARLWIPATWADTTASCGFPGSSSPWSSRSPSTDPVQTRHAILRNFPFLGHFRYWLEAIGPELRQYIVTSNNEERPFSRDQRRWVYASSKQQNNYFGFRADEEIESPGYLVLKHDTLPAPDAVRLDAVGWPLPCAKVLGAARGRAKAFRPKSVVNVSAMSFGSLSAPAIEALNRGCAMSGCLHNTGEGGVSRYHMNGADLIWRLGTGYFGCRDESGRFSLPRFKDVVA
jgi:glutamate synthase (ferredoxin)